MHNSSLNMYHVQHIWDDFVKGDVEKGWKHMAPVLPLPYKLLIITYAPLNRPAINCMDKVKDL